MQFRSKAKESPRAEPISLMNKAPNRKKIPPTKVLQSHGFYPPHFINNRTYYHLNH